MTERGVKLVRALGLTVVAIAMALAPPGPLALAQGKPATVTVGLLPPFPFYWASYVAADAGLFKEQGLNVEEIQLN